MAEQKDRPKVDAEPKVSKPNIKAKPCPNPSCKRGKVVLRGPSAETYRVRCDACGLMGPRGKTGESAIGLWNGIYRPGEPYGERCFLWHDWSKWEDIKVHQHSVFKEGQEPLMKGEYLVQRRSCKRCGEVRYRHEKIFDVTKDV